MFDAGGCRTSRDGDGTAVLGDPRLALVWLVDDLSARGLTPAAGQFASTGTCMVPLAVRPGDTVRADYGALGQVSAQFTN